MIHRAINRLYPRRATFFHNYHISIRSALSVLVHKYISVTRWTFVGGPWLINNRFRGLEISIQYHRRRWCSLGNRVQSTYKILNYDVMNMMTKNNSRSRESPRFGTKRSRHFRDEVFWAKYPHWTEKANSMTLTHSFYRRLSPIATGMGASSMQALH